MMIIQLAWFIVHQNVEINTTFNHILVKPSSSWTSVLSIYFVINPFPFWPIYKCIGEYATKPDSNKRNKYGLSRNLNKLNLGNQL